MASVKEYEEKFGKLPPGIKPNRIFPRCNMFLDASMLEDRKKGGATLTYIQGQRVIQNLNEVYGDNWEFTIKHFEHLYTDTATRDKDGKIGWDVGAYCQGRLVVCGKAFEDVGYGQGTDYSSKAWAYESAGKEAVTDSLKRCAKDLGNYFGLALYDKEQEAVLTVDDEGWKKLMRLASKYCSKETCDAIDRIKNNVKEEYKITLPSDMKPFMWREILEPAWMVYWDSFTK